MAKSAVVRKVLDDSEPDWLIEAQYVASLYEPPETGRPSTLTDIARLQKLLRLVAQGNYMETACLAAGFSKATLHSWRELAKHGNVAAIAFTNAMEKAEAWAEADAVSDVAKAGKAGPQFWAASATRLERRHPDRWGKRQDDANQPRVVVQIGVSAGDVQVKAAIQPTFASQTSALSTDMHRLTGDVGSDNGGYVVNQPQDTTRG